MDIVLPVVGKHVKFWVSVSHSVWWNTETSEHIWLLSSGDLNWTISRHLHPSVFRKPLRPQWLHYRNRHLPGTAFKCMNQFSKTNFNLGEKIINPLICYYGFCQITHRLTCFRALARFNRWHIWTCCWDSGPAAKAPLRVHSLFRIDRLMPDTGARWSPFVRNKNQHICVYITDVTNKGTT